MSRSYSRTALTLRVKPSGESNREAWFLCAEEGIFRATVFGGPKSRLRSQVAPFHQGTVWVYHNSIKDSRKLTDFDVILWRPGLREMYERTMAADAIAGTILSTHAGGGNWKTALELASDSLDCMEKADNRSYKRILLNFLWAWTGFLGIRPDLRSCAACACDIPADGVLYYDPKEASLYCISCTGLSGGNTDITIKPGARRWLLAIGDLGFLDAQRYTLDNESFRQAKVLVLSLLAEALGRKLKVWDILDN